MKRRVPAFLLALVSRIRIGCARRTGADGGGAGGGRGGGGGAALRRPIRNLSSA